MASKGAPRLTAQLAVPAHELAEQRRHHRDWREKQPVRVGIEFVETMSSELPNFGDSQPRAKGPIYVRICLQRRNTGSSRGGKQRRESVPASFAQQPTPDARTKKRAARAGVKHANTDTHRGRASRTPARLSSGLAYAGGGGSVSPFIRSGPPGGAGSRWRNRLLLPPRLARPPTRRPAKAFLRLRLQTASLPCPLRKNRKLP